MFILCNVLLISIFVVIFCLDCILFTFGSTTPSSNQKVSLVNNSTSLQVIIILQNRSLPIPILNPLQII